MGLHHRRRRLGQAGRCAWREDRREAVRRQAGSRGFRWLSATENPPHLQPLSRSTLRGHDASDEFGRPANDRTVGPVPYKRPHYAEVGWQQARPKVAFGETSRSTIRRSDPYAAFSGFKADTGDDRVGGEVEEMEYRQRSRKTPRNRNKHYTGYGTCT
jgi:hypothetical protein